MESIMLFNSRGSLGNVYFPSVTLCNINQGRLSLFHQFQLSANETLLNAVLSQAYFGSRKEINTDLLQKGRDFLVSIILACRLK